MSPSLDDEVLDGHDVDQILNSLGPIMRWGFNSDKLYNTPKIIKYLKFPPKFMRTALVDAKDSHDTTLLQLHQSQFIDQRAAFELVLSYIAAGVPAAFKMYETVWMRRRALSESLGVSSEYWRPLSEYLQGLSEMLRVPSGIVRAFSDQVQAAAKLMQASIIWGWVEAIWEWGQAISKWVQAISERVQHYTERMQDKTKWVQRGAAPYLTASEQDLVASERDRSASGWYLDILADKGIISAPKVFPKNIQSTFEDIRAAFDALQADFEQLPSVRLNRPPIVLRIVGPISMDLRPFHRGKNMYSLGSMFLESLMCDFWISWDLRSYEVLVAAKIIHKGRLYPTAFTSELSLLVKRLIKANLQFALRSYDKGRRRLALKSPAESTGLGVSTTPTFLRAGHDALIKGAVEGSPMQRSLIATISLGVRNLTSCITPIGEQPECFGGFAEIWRAQLTSSNGKFSVAVKYLRLCVTEVTKHLYREIRIWQSLEHHHVLPLLGICYNANTYESIRASDEHIVDPMVSIGIVCPWMVNGTLVDYLKQRQTKAENIEHRLRLLIQVCSGLMYLHLKNIVHGDLHGGNILIDSAGCARLADFGLSAVLAECRGTSRSNLGGISSPRGGALRWAAPELVLQGGAEARLHRSADIYSIGGLILQACTGGVPYSYYNEPRVLGAIIAGEKPRRPTSDEANISDALWSVIEECWQDDPLQRPTAAAVASRLQDIHSGLEDEQA